MSITIRTLLYLLCCALITGCSSQMLPGSSSQHAGAINASSGYRVVLADGRNQFIADPSQYLLKPGDKEQMLAFRGRGFELAIKISAVRRFSRIKDGLETNLTIPQHETIGDSLRPFTARRAPTGYITPTCGIDMSCGPGGLGCNPVDPSCRTCPDCSIQIPVDGGPVACYSSPCGNDGGGGVGVGIFPLDSSVTCLYQFADDFLDCGYANNNPAPSRPNKNYSLGYLHSGNYVRLSCDVSSFATLPIVGFAVYKDASQVYTKDRDDIGPSPDYWFAPDETGKPIPPPPPAHTSISAQYEYFGMPFLVAGHCDGAD